MRILKNSLPSGRRAADPQAGSSSLATCAVFGGESDKELVDALHTLALSGVTLTGPEGLFITRVMCYYANHGTLADPLRYEGPLYEELDVTMNEDARDRARGILQCRIDQVLDLEIEPAPRAGPPCGCRGTGCDVCGEKPLPF